MFNDFRFEQDVAISRIVLSFTHVHSERSKTRRFGSKLTNERMFGVFGDSRFVRLLETPIENTTKITQNNVMVTMV